MISKEDISIICNYQERSTPIQPNTSIAYMEFVSEDDDNYLRELKMKNRELAIDAVLDDKLEEYNNREIPWSTLSNDQSSIGIVSPSIYSIKLSNPNKFTSYEKLWDVVMNHIEINTQGHHPFMQKTSMGVNQSPNFTYTPDPNKTDLENNQTRSRRLLSKIMMASNAIASTLTRIGPATFIIVGTDVVDILLQSLFTQSNTKNSSIIGNIAGFHVILSKNIKPNKIIIGRSESKLESGGLIVMNDMNDFYLTETRRTFYKNFIWFDVN